MENNEVPLLMLSVSADDDGGLTFQSGFSQLLGDEVTDDERTQVNAVIDQLLDMLEPIFMRVADEAFEDNGEDDEDE